MVWLLAVVAPPLLGQVFEVNGGASSLYQAQAERCRFAALVIKLRLAPEPWPAGL